MRAIRLHRTSRRAWPHWYSCEASLSWALSGCACKRPSAERCGDLKVARRLARPSAGQVDVALRHATSCTVSSVSGARCMRAQPFPSVPAGICHEPSLSALVQATGVQMRTVPPALTPGVVQGCPTRRLPLLPRSVVLSPRVRRCSAVGKSHAGRTVSHFNGVLRPELFTATARPHHSSSAMASPSTSPRP